MKNKLTFSSLFSPPFCLFVSPLSVRWRTSPERWGAGGSSSSLCLNQSEKLFVFMTSEICFWSKNPKHFHPWSHDQLHFSEAAELLVCLKLLMLIGHSSRLHQLQSANVHDINSESSEDHCWFLLSVFSSLLFSFLKSGVLFGPKCRKPEYFIKCTVDSFCHTFMHCAPERPQVQWRENYLQNAPAQRGPLENTGENPVVGGGGAHLYHPDIYFFISTNTQINDKCEFLTSLCPSCGSSGRHQKPRPTLRTAALKSKEI